MAEGVLEKYRVDDEKKNRYIMIDQMNRIIIL